MVLNDQQRKELLEAAKPLIQWLNDNCHPHCSAHVDQNTVELSEGIANIQTDEFIKD